MKKILSVLLILFSFIFFSCTKTQLDNSSAQNEISGGKINPQVLQCNAGQHWDFYLRKCVDDCPSGYHNDSITGACVADGGNPPIIISYAGVNISYYTTNHILSFNSSTDVNTVLDQLDADYENYNTIYENQYPNFSALQLDSLDSVNNFDQLRTYKNFEGKFAGLTSQRSIFENNETTWLNNNMAGADPDSLDYTVDNSANAICNSSYQFIIAGTTYKWTSTGLITVGGTQTPIVNSPTSSCFSNYRGGDPLWIYTSDRSRKCKLKVAVNNCLIRGEGKAKVKSFRKKSNGKYVRSRLDLRIRILGPLLYENVCSLFQNVDQSKPAQGYQKRFELKTLKRVQSNQAYIYMNTFSGIFYSNISGLSGTKTL